MAYAGQILDNPVSGERIIFRKTAADTNGEYLDRSTSIPHQRRDYEVRCGV